VPALFIVAPSLMLEACLLTYQLNEG